MMGNSEHVIMVATFFEYHGQWTTGQPSGAVDSFQEQWADVSCMLSCSVLSPVTVIQCWVSGDRCYSAMFTGVVTR